MKKVLSNLIAPVVIMAALFSCEDEISNSFDVLDIAPVIDEVTPNGSVKIGSEFDIIIKAHDGESSPLASISAKLKDADGNELATTTGTVTGTADSLVWAAADFGSTALDTGDYTISVTVTDVANLSVSGDYSFVVFDLPFDATYPEMYIAGNFNSWGADALELVAANTWQITATLDGGGWKFKNTPDWSDIDWGDSDCDGVMEVATGGGPDTNCGHTGESIITFNDKTLAYTIELVEPIAQNITGLYLVGSFNNFEGSDDFEFTLDSDNTWILEEVLLKEGDVFKFSEAADLSKKNWGDNEPDGEADLFGKSLVLDNTYEEAFYKVTFNDATLAYTIEFVRGLYPENLYLVGGSTVAGWDNAAAYPFEKLAEGKFRTYQYIEVAGDGFKFLPTLGSWDGDYGMGASEGEIEQDGEANVAVAADGFYRVDVDFTTGTYAVVASNWGIIGDATTGGWDTDTDMTLSSAAKGSFTWTSSIVLVSGSIKFRENDGWDVNYGDTGTDGTLDFNSSTNIPIATAGTYTVTMTLDSKNGYTYTLVQ